MSLVVKLIGCVALLAAAAATVAYDINEECKINETVIACRCVGNEEFLLPEEYNYENLTSLNVASCSFLYLRFSSLSRANQITEIIVQNISEQLKFDAYVTSRNMTRLTLSNIRRIPLITHDTFLSLHTIETLRIQNVRIDRFEERFDDVAITHFSMINVTIESMDGLNLTLPSRKGKTLIIENSVFRNVTESLNFDEFSNVTILRSKFRLQKPDSLRIAGVWVTIEDCVFSNASANVVAENVKINAICADGKSSMRVQSLNIESVNNRLPTEIVYAKNRTHRNVFNNTVCIAGNCKCAKSSGESTRRATTVYVSSTSSFAFQFLLLAVTVPLSTLS